MEISRRAYNEGEHYDAQNTYRRAERKISETHDYDGSPEGNELGYSDGSRNERGTSRVSRQAVGEELRYDAGGSLSSVDRDGGRDNVKELSASSNEHLNTTGPKATSKELYATNILLDALRVKGDVRASGENSNTGNPGGSQNQRSVKEKLSMRDTVEQTRDLVAVHNMTEQNLRGALRLGGLPVTE